jgi:hypothetical protein
MQKAGHVESVQGGHSSKPAAYACRDHAVGGERAALHSANLVYLCHNSTSALDFQTKCVPSELRDRLPANKINTGAAQLSSPCCNAGEGQSDLAQRRHCHRSISVSRVPTRGLPGSPIAAMPHIEHSSATASTDSYPFCTDFWCSARALIQHERIAITVCLLLQQLINLQWSKPPGALNHIVSDCKTSCS